MHFGCVCAWHNVMKITVCVMLIDMCTRVCLGMYVPMYANRYFFPQRKATYRVPGVQGAKLDLTDF